MSLKRKFSIGALTLVCAVMLLFAFEIFYMAQKETLMPLMEDSIGRSTMEIKEYSPELLKFIFTSVKIIAALLFSLSIGILILLFGAFRKNKKWALQPIFFMLFTWLTAAVLIYSSQASAPWQIWLALLIVVAIALVLTLTDKNKRS